MPCSAPSNSNTTTTKQLLYIIDDPKKGADPEKKGLFAFCCFSFATQGGEKKAIPEFKTSIEMTHSPTDKITLVWMDEKDESSVVLCKQDSPKDGAIPITLFVIQHHQVLNFQIPFSEPKLLDKVSVYFDRLGTLLMVLIPGFYFQLINCSLIQDIQLNICLNSDSPEKHLIPTLPGQQERIHNYLDALDRKVSKPPPGIHLQIFRDWRVATQQGQELRTILDVASGSIMRFRLNRAAIFELCTNPAISTELQVKALNLAIVHAQDSTLIAEVMNHLCVNQNCTSLLFKEYLLGTSHKMYLAKNLQEQVARACAIVLPSTIIGDHTIFPPPNHFEREPFPFKLDTNPDTPTTVLQERPPPKKASSLPGSLPGTPSKEDSGKIALQQSQDKCLAPTTQLKYVSPSTTPKKKVVWLPQVATKQLSPRGAEQSKDDLTKGLFGKLINMFDFKNDKKIDDPYLPPVKVTIDESNSGLDPNKYQYIQFLANQMYTQLSKEVKMSRQQCQYYGQQYRDFQAICANELWGVLAKCSIEDDNTTPKQRRDIFSQFSHFHVALEELCFPFPRGFKKRFTNSGYRCLPRNVFLQFIEHGVLELSYNFVKSVLSNLTQSPEDRTFKYLLLSKLPEPEAVKLMTLDPPVEEYTLMCSYLLEHKLRTHTWTYQKGVDMGEMEEADFLPLQIYLSSLGQKHPDIQFINQWAEGMYSFLTVKPEEGECGGGGARGRKTSVERRQHGSGSGGDDNRQHSSVGDSRSEDKNKTPL